MTENAPPKGAGGGGVPNGDSAAGLPFYEKQRQRLKELIAKKRTLDRKIAAQEDTIYQKETEYLESTPGGNIITGFDNYIKGTSGGGGGGGGGSASQRGRKTGFSSEANRVFSRSSVSYNANGDAMTPASATSTPAAPTPVSASFAGRDSTGAPTPTSTTGNGTTKAAGPKKSKKAAAAAAAAAALNGEDEADSEADGRGNKKVRTNFGAMRR